MTNFSKKALIFIAILAFSLPTKSFACACGCGVMSVATSSLIPNCEGGTAFLQYDSLNQSRNWHNSEKSNGHNHDKKIYTQTTTLGAQYMFNRDWGASIRLPYVTRYVNKHDHDHNTVEAKHSHLGDIKVNAIYSGFFDDVSTGLTLGLKLPTGSTNDKSFSRSTQIGTGSTDLILGAYHIGNFGKSDFGYFAQAAWQDAFITHQNYTPGYEFSYSLGSYYNAGQFAFAKKVAPMIQIIGSKKGRDNRMADGNHRANTGYHHVFFAPGIEVTIKDFRIYADVAFPVYRYVNGNQLVPQNIYKVILGYNF